MRGGAQLVLKTRPSIASRGFDSFAFRQMSEPPAVVGGQIYWRRRLTVWQWFAKPPRTRVCRFNSCRLRHVIADCRSFNCRLSALTSHITNQLAIGNRQSQTFGPVAQRNQSATVRRSRPHVQIVPGPPINKILRSSRIGKARVSETRLCRFESYLRSQVCRGVH